VLALLVGGWFFYDSIQSQIQGEETVAVPYVVGIPQALAKKNIEDAGLIPQVRLVSNSDVEEGVVFGQNPTEGTRVDKETVCASTCPRQARGDVRASSAGGSDAVAELTGGLVAQVAR
jgi:hypothetical protein